MSSSLPSGAHTTRGTLDLEKEIQSPQVSGNYIFGAAAEESVVNAVDVDASLEQLKDHSSSTQKHAAHQLSQYLVTARLEMSTEAFEQHQNKLYQRIFLLLRGTDVNERLGAVAALDELIIKTATPFAEMKALVKISNNLSDALRTNSDHHVLTAVSHALGHIARSGSMPNVDFIEYEINRGLEWIHEGRSHQRLAACLVLKEMAVNAPAAFHVKISDVFDGVTPLLADKDRDIREAVADVLSICLSANTQRGGQFYLRWHCRCFDMIINGLKNTSEKTEPVTHGALLLASVMMKCSGNFIIPRFRELCDAIMNLMPSLPSKKNNKSNLIRSLIIEILPQLANVFPDAFAGMYLRKSLDCLTFGCTVSELRGISFLSLGQLSLVIPHHVSSCLAEVVTVVKEGLSPTNRRKGLNVPFKDALTCLANLVTALGSVMEHYITDLTPVMFSEGLSPSLIDTLVVISKSMPVHKVPLQKRLLMELSTILRGKPYTPPGIIAPWVHRQKRQSLLHRSSRHPSSSNFASFSSHGSGSGWDILTGNEECDGSSVHSLDANVNAPQGKPSGRNKGKNGLNHRLLTARPFSTTSTSEGEELLVLALHTLGGYEIGWDGICLLPFVKDCVVKYVEHSSFHVRKEAALCCCLLLVEPASSALNFGPSVEATEGVLQCLLQVVVADPVPDIRQAIIRALDPRFDSFLCQAHHLQVLFLFVGDADFTIRLETISLLGRLAFLNPAYILPSLRSTLMYLIVELQYNTIDTNARIEATCMICRFLMPRSLHQLVLPLLDVLVSVLPIGAQSSQLATAALDTLGGLSMVAKGEMAVYFDRLMPDLFASMSDWSCVRKREVAFRTFGRLISACEYVSQLHVDFPLLLSSVISVLREGTLSSMPWSLRREALRTLGTLGALEPYLYQQIEIKDKEQRINAAEAGYTFTPRFGGDSGAAVNAPVSAAVTSSFFITQNNKKQENNVPRDERGSRDEIERLSMDRMEGDVNMVVVKDRLYMYRVKEGWTYPGTAMLSASCAMWEQCTPEAEHYVAPPQPKLTIENKDYYPLVAIEALTDMLRDSSLDTFHKTVLGAIRTILKSLGMKCIPILGHVIPNMIHVGRNCEPGLREILLLQLGQVAGMVRHHMRPFLPELFELIIDYWNDNLEQVVILMENIVFHLREDFAPYAPRLLSLLLQSIAPPSLLISELTSIGAAMKLGRHTMILSEDGIASRRKLVAVLKCFCVIHRVMTLYVHVIIPALMKLINTIAGTGISPQSTKLLKICVCSLGNIISYGLLLQHPSNAAQLVYPLVRVMDVWACDSLSIELQDAILEVFCSMSVQLGVRYLIFEDHLISERFNTWFPIKSVMAERYLAIVAILREYSNCGIGFGGGDGYSGEQQQSSQSMIGSQGGHTVALLKLLGDPAQSYLGMYETAEQGGGPLHGTATSSPSRTANDTPPSVHRLKFNLHNLRCAWNVTQRSTRDDWKDWITRFRLVLLSVSPNPALRGCSVVAQAYPPIGKKLFYPAFVSCWLELDTKNKDDLIQSLETLFRSPEVPIEILHVMLNLAEFMEKNVDPLPIDISVLFKLASRCKAYAKALHFKVTEFYVKEDPALCIEDLIFINEKLGHVDGAKGILVYADNHLKTVGTTVKESWLAELGQWDEALGIFRAKLAKLESEEDPSYVTSTLGCMRCMEALGDWGEVVELYDKCLPVLEGKDDKLRGEFETLAAGSSWAMKDWERFSRLVKAMEGSSVKTSFFHAVLAIHERDFERCELHIDVARRLLENQFTSLLMESYNRAYSGMVTIQLLSELEEIMEYLKVVEFQKHTEVNWASSGEGGDQSVGEAETMRLGLISRWDRRLEYTAPDERVWKDILILHSLIMTPTDDIQNSLHFARLCQQNGNFSLSRKVLERSQCRVAELSGATHEGGRTQQYAESSSKSDLEPGVLVPQQGIMPLLRLACLEHKWVANKCDRQQTLSELRILTDTIHMSEVDLKVRCLLRLGQWELKQSMQQSSSTRDQSMDTLVNVASKYELATELQKDNYQAWQRWAMINLRMAEHHQNSSDSPKLLQKTSGRRGENQHGKLEHADICGGDTDLEEGNSRDQNLPVQYLVNAVEGFLRTIALGRYHESAFVQQNMLHLISVLCTHGHIPEVHAVLSSGLATSPVDSWLGVLPQLMARINIKHKESRAVLHSLLDRLGRHHPQALVYPMCVALKSPQKDRREAATMLMANLQQCYGKLMNDALLVSDELINVAIMWHEHCHESLEEASRRYFQLGDVRGMLAVLLPMHSMLQSGAKTKREEKFLDRYGEHLQAAYKCLMRYINIMKLEGLQPPTNTSSSPCPPLKANQQQHRHQQQHEPKLHQNNAEMTLVEAWNMYYKVFRDIIRQLTQMTTLKLRYVSPKLLAAHDLELVVPGSYRISGSGVRIKSFLPTVHLILSKQRPRKIVMKGEDGKDYCFLLKGREDLRQDERAMQLFGQINALLACDQKTMHDLSIRRYTVIPLSHNAGLLGWLNNTDTLHSLIREYRERHKITLDIEHRYMVEAAQPCEYERLKTMQKVEIFCKALETTSGHELNMIMWLKSENSEAWLERRSNYIHSLAVVSMAGYILGLGDRHPSNLMIDNISGKIVHIDFGDCFEIAMHREKFPEKVPFRLTRMLRNAMEISGVEGTYRATCERVMIVLRESSDSLLAMLEAFVYDPLISLRFLRGGGEEEDVEGKNGDDSSASSTVRQLVAQLPQPAKKRGISEEDDISQTNDVVDVKAAAVATTTAASLGDDGGISKSDNNTTTQTPQSSGNVEQQAAATVTTVEVNNNKSIDHSSVLHSKWLPSGKNVDHQHSTVNPEDAEGIRNEMWTKDDTTSAKKSYNKLNETEEEETMMISSVTTVTTTTTTTTTTAHHNTDLTLEGWDENENENNNEQQMTSESTIVVDPRCSDDDLKSYKNRTYLSMEQMAKSLVMNARGCVESPGKRNYSEPHFYGQYSIGNEPNIMHGKEVKEVHPGAHCKKSLKIISRVKDKLSGRDFDNIEPFTVKEQVERLISEATSAENLSQLFTGWCSFW